MAYYSDAVAELISEVGCTCDMQRAWRDLRAERDRLQRGMDDALARAERAEAEATGRCTTAYLCAVCGGIAYAEIYSLDSGTTLTCDRCAGKTVVDLDTPKTRTARYRAEAQRIRAEKGLERL